MKTKADKRSREYRLDVEISPDLAALLDKARGLVPRATFVRALLEERLIGKKGHRQP